MTEDKNAASRLAIATVDPDRRGFVDTRELDLLEEIIGRERAVEALEFGWRMKSKGFNVHVSGPALRPARSSISPPLTIDGGRDAPAGARSAARPR